MENKINEILNTKLVFKSPYDAGRDAAINGANTDNCHFRFFKDAESTKEWERGKKSV